MISRLQAEGTAGLLSLRTPQLNLADVTCMTCAQAIQFLKEFFMWICSHKYENLEKTEIRIAPNLLLPLKNNQLTNPDHRIKDTHVDC